MQWNILIVENEEWAFIALKNMLKLAYSANKQTFTNATDISGAVDLINQNYFDLIFMDIHLMDGLSFEIFEQVSIHVPVIFTTAYEQYALQAFQHRGFAYLLKPFDQEELENVMSRVSPLLPEGEKRHFLVKYGNFLKSLAISDIAYFMADGKELYALERESGTAYIIEDTLTHVVSQVDPSLFFQVKRKFLAHFESIRSMIKIGRNRIKLELVPKPPKAVEVIVSEERSPSFQQWLDQ